MKDAQNGRRRRKERNWIIWNARTPTRRGEVNQSFINKRDWITSASQRAQTKPAPHRRSCHLQAEKKEMTSKSLAYWWISQIVNPLTPNSSYSVCKHFKKTWLQSLIISDQRHRGVQKKEPLNPKPFWQDDLGFHFIICKPKTNWMQPWITHPHSIPCKDLSDSNSSFTIVFKIKFHIESNFIQLIWIWTYCWWMGIGGFGGCFSPTCRHALMAI